MRKLGFILLGLTALIGLEFRAQATTFLELKSTYLGDGWFQYQMSVFNDPFFTEADISMQMEFTNQIDQSTTSTNWYNSATNSMSSSWSFSGSQPARPYVETYLIRSSETSYKMATGALSVLSLVAPSLNPLRGDEGGSVFSQNIVGFARLPCLVPCTPDEADDAPTNFVYNLKLLPDVNITQLIQTNSDTYGVVFDWGYESTFLLQGTSDLVSWTNVATVWSTPPETVWTTNISLNSFGNCFRVALVANGHTNAPALNSPTLQTIAKGGPVPPRVTSCQYASGKVSVSVATAPGQAVQIQAIDSHLSVQQSQQVLAKSGVTIGKFDAASLPNPVYFQAALVP